MRVHSSKDDPTRVVEGGPAASRDTDAPRTVFRLDSDVSSLRQVEARLAEADRLAAMGTIAAGIAHEINNPLAYMTINLDIMTRTLRALRGAIDAEDTTNARAVALMSELEGLVVVAREGAERVRHIVRDFKLFARGGGDRRGPVQVQHVLESTLQMMFNDISHRARLVRSYEPVPLIDADDARLGQLFLNLLINALQALGESAFDRNEIRVSTRTATDGNAIIEIADTGPGIAPDVLERIFEPFFSTKPIGVGTGLGLPICQSIVTSFGGSLVIESQLGRGTVCRISLPPAAATAHSAVAPMQSEAPLVRRSRVLVIDDEPALLGALGQVLGRDHDVTCTASGSEALDLMREKSFDVVLCDLMMPIVSGIDVYETLRRERPGFERQIVFITAGAFTPAAYEFLRSVPNRKLEKPFTWEQLREVLREMQHATPHPVAAI